MSRKKWILAAIFGLAMLNLSLCWGILLVVKDDRLLYKLIILFFSVYAVVEFVRWRRIVSPEEKTGVRNSALGASVAAAIMLLPLFLPVTVPSRTIFTDIALGAGFMISTGWPKNSRH